MRLPQKTTSNLLSFVFFMACVLFAVPALARKAPVTNINHFIPASSSFAVILKHPVKTLDGLEGHINRLGFGRFLAKFRNKAAKELQKRNGAAKTPQNWEEILSLMGLGTDSTVAVIVKAKANSPKPDFAIVLEVGDVSTAESFFVKEVGLAIVGRSQLRRKAWKKRFQAGLPRTKIPGGFISVDPQSGFSYAVLYKRFLIFAPKPGMIKYVLQSALKGNSAISSGFKKFSPHSIFQFYANYAEYNKMFVYNNPAIRKIYPPQVLKLLKSFSRGFKAAWMEALPYKRGYQMRGWVSMFPNFKNKQLSTFIKVKPQKLNTIKWLPRSTVFTMSQNWTLAYMDLLGKTLRAMKQGTIAMFLTPWEMILGQEATISLHTGPPRSLRASVILRIKKPDILEKQLKDLQSMLGSRKNIIKTVMLKGVKVLSLNLAQVQPPQKGKIRRRRGPKGTVSLASFRGYAIITYELMGRPLSLMNEILLVAKGKRPSLLTKKSVQQRIGKGKKANAFVYLSFTNAARVAKGFLPPNRMSQMGLAVFGMMGEMAGTSSNRERKMTFRTDWQLPKSPRPRRK